MSVIIGAQLRLALLNYGLPSTPRLSSHWVKAFMERSRTMPMDFDLHVGPYHSCYYFEQDFKDIIELLSDFTRICSLHLTGTHHNVLPFLDSLCNPLPVQCLSLFLPEFGDKFEHIIPDNLFGGNAPIRRLHFTAYGRIVMPYSLLHGVTHFTTTESISPSELLDMLPHMPALTYLEFRPPDYPWSKFKMRKLNLSPIQVPQLTTLITHTSNNPETFLPLNQLLLLNAGVKRRLEVRLSEFGGWHALGGWTSISSLVQAAGGFQHIHFSGPRDGWFRMWSGHAATTWEDAEFCLMAHWKGYGGSPYHGNSPPPFVALGVAQVRRLVIDFPHVNVWKCKPKDLSWSYWWDILKTLPGIEELELYHTGFGLGGFWREVWMVGKPPAVLPALRRVRVAADVNYASHQYAIIGDFPTRKIVRLPNSTNSAADTTSFSETESMEELEKMSRGLLRFLQGLAGRWQRDWENDYYED